MAVRKIDYKVSAAGITPGVEQFGGVQSEHRATCLSFTVDSALREAVAALGGKAVYRFDGYDGEGNVVRGEPQELKENTVPVFYLEEWITRHGGRIRVYLVISVIKDDSTEMELYSFPANLRLNNLPEGEDKEGENYESLTTLAQSAKDSAKVAVESMNAAIEAQHKTESAKVSLEEDVEIHFLGGDAASAVDIELVVDDELNKYSTNPVQNWVLEASLASKVSKDYVNSNTLVIPKFENIDNTEFKPLFKKCADTWINAYNSHQLVYKTLGVDANGSDGMKDSINPMIYKKHSGEEEGMAGFTDEYREICNEARACIYDSDDTTKCHLNCISLCNMLVMGVTFERSRLFNPTNVIGSAGYGFDICKLLHNGSIKKQDNGTYLIKYSSNNTLDMTNFTEILTQLKVHGKSQGQAEIEDTAYGKLGLCKNVVASTETPNDNAIKTTDIRAGDIICTGGGHSLFVLDTSGSGDSFAVTCVHITNGGALTTITYTVKDLDTKDNYGNVKVTRVARPYYSYLNTEKVWISTKTKAGTTNDNGNIDLGLAKATILLSCYALSADGSTQYTCTPYVSATYNTWFCNITKVTSQETVASTKVTIVCKYISA